jgi:hypothetical protein
MRTLIALAIILIATTASAWYEIKHEWRETSCEICGAPIYYEEEVRLEYGDNMPIYDGGFYTDTGSYKPVMTDFSYPEHRLCPKCRDEYQEVIDAMLVEKFELWRAVRAEERERNHNESRAKILRGKEIKIKELEKELEQLRETICTDVLDSDTTISPDVLDGLIEVGQP